MNLDVDASEVSRLLWSEWDPIGINATSSHDDEYETYVSGIVRLIESGADAHRIADRLDSLARDSMGLSPDREKNEIVAIKLHALG